MPRLLVLLALLLTGCRSPDTGRVRELVFWCSNNGGEIQFAQEFAGRCVMQYDTPLELYNHPANRFVAGFIGTPPMNFLSGQLQQTADGLCFTGTENTVQIPLSSVVPQTALMPYTGKLVTLGIRAEHLTLSSVDGHSVPLLVVIDAIENMGNEALAYVTLDSNRLVARVLPMEAMSLRAGQSVLLYLTVSQAHFFDDATELVIR